MSRFCADCGASLPENARFCPECGTAVGGAPAPEKRTGPTERRGRLPADHRGRRGRAGRPAVDGWLGPYGRYVMGALGATVVLLLFIGMMGRSGGPDGGGAGDAGLAAMERIQQFQRLLLEDPSDTNAITNLGHAYFDAGIAAMDRGDVVGGRDLMSQAAVYYQRALEDLPESPEIRTDLGTAYNRLGRRQEAIAEFRKVLEYSPGFVTALFNLGIVHQQMGELDTARVWFERTVERAPGSALGQSARQQLDRLLPPE